MDYNMAPPAERCGKFHARSDTPFRHLIDSLLLDDEVFVPTQDFMALPVFLRRLGGAQFLDLLESGSFKFVRFPGAIAYAGGGAGMIVVGVEYPDGRKRPITAPIAESVRASLQSVEMFADHALISALEKATVEMNVEEAFGPIADETYKDVQQNVALRTWFSSRSQTFQKLAGIENNQARVYGGPDVGWTGDEIQVLLALATANLELRMAQLLSCDNSASTNPVQAVIGAKVARAATRSGITAFATLRQLADIPDIGAGILSNPQLLKDVLKLRGRSDAVAFRKWFRERRGDQPSDLAKAYVDLLREVPGSQSWPSRIMRYLVTTAAGFIPGAGTVTGPIVTAADSFLTDYLFGRRRPIFFIDELKAFGERISPVS